MAIKRPKKYKLPRPLTLVKPLDGNGYFDPHHSVSPILFIDKIKNMPTHGVFFYEGKIETGLHIDSFEELTEDKV